MPRQFWVRASGKSTCAVSASGIQYFFKSEDIDQNTAKKHTILEVFIPNSVFLANDYMVKNGSIQVGVAWKTPGDQINNGGANPIDEWWLPQGSNINSNPSVVDGTGIYLPAEYGKQA